MAKEKEKKVLKYTNPDKEARALLVVGKEATDSQFLSEYLLMGGAVYLNGKKIPNFINSKGTERKEKIRDVVAKIFPIKKGKK